MPIKKVLVANRGEIAVRIQRTCHDMGISTVAVFSDADADALHVRVADQAVWIGGAPSAESYLRGDRVIEVAQQVGADAIHPGYGFLAENAEFAQACAVAGIKFIGPSAEAIRSMGSKIEAKRLVIDAGVPVVPGYQGDDQSDEVLSNKASEIGFPVLLKASAGGGGKGMRVVRDAAGVQAGIESARREAKKAFGDDRLLVEKYVENPRHIEIQILGDEHGQIVHLFERECSIQRRHQKIIEETPSVALSEEKRAEMGAAAVAVGEAIGYSNAGTVEFILAPNGEFYFLEVNTRLQVEHPVTEMITGVDLVREQIRVAEGHPLPFAQEDLRATGASVECRLYAEDPDNDFLPATGLVLDWHVPAEPWVRIDTGIVAGDEISVHYDPMVAKVITHGATRDDANRRMARALRQLSVHGLKTNREFLIRVLEHPAYEAGELSTHFIDQHPELFDKADMSRRWLLGAVVLHGFAARARSRTVVPHMRHVFRTNPMLDEIDRYQVAGTEHTVGYRQLSADRFRVDIDGEREEFQLVSAGAEFVVMQDESGIREKLRVVRHGDRFFAQGMMGSLSAMLVPRFPDPMAAVDAGGCTAPMTGTVLKVLVAAGQEVSKGEVLVIMEAMKMEHSVTAPDDGVVAEVRVAQGDLVDEGVALVVMVETEESS